MKRNTDLRGVGTLHSAVPERMRRFGPGLRAAPPLCDSQFRYGPVNRFRSSGGLSETIETDGVDGESSEKARPPQERFPDIDRLHESMKRRGYVRYARFHDEAENDMENPILKTRTMLGETFTDEPVLGLRRDGEALRLTDGHHRLSLVKLRDIEDCPAFASDGRWGDDRGAFGSTVGPNVDPRTYRWYATRPQADVSRPDQFEIGVPT